MSIGRLTASLASATNEITVAAAALNFDFSLIKVDAPEEFKVVGGGLSANRRLDAEDGQAHITARKLAALFDKIIPSVPCLIKAYGRRASEISASPVANPKPSSRDGPFATHVGADGTTIWAAATSGRGAIAIHLLACLLARIWPASEAISLWTEIVERRRQEIHTAFANDEEIDLATLSAARQTFSRRQLAEWDTSARGWLRAADIVKSSELKQLMLIVKNIDACVDHGFDVYEGVIRAWRRALTAMDSLVRGVPQRVSDGSVLTASWAWHLYPDIIVVRAINTDVHFKDPLIGRGGCLTIGLELEDVARKDDGVYWSLPLANLRYYGDPVISERTAARDASRISFTELAQVGLGSLFGQWSGFDVHAFDGADLFCAIWDSISRAAVDDSGVGIAPKQISLAKAFLRSNLNWMRVLVDAARVLIEAEGVERESAELLVKLGQRRGKQFLPTDIAPYFGLRDIDVLLRLLLLEEDAISLLREATAALAMKKGDVVPVIIRYVHKSCQGYEYASTSSDSRYSRKRTRTGYPVNLPRYKRWTSSERFESHDLRSTHVGTYEVRDWPSRRSEIENLGEIALSREEAAIKSESLHIMYVANVRYECFAGDPSRAALFVPDTDWRYCRLKYSALAARVFNVNHVAQILRTKQVSIERLIASLSRKVVSSLDDKREYKSLQARYQISSLRAFASAERVYKLLSNVTVSPNIVSRPFHKACWVRNLQEVPEPQKSSRSIDAFRGEPPSRAQSFACIALLESGVHDIDPCSLEPVMALATSDSIYVAAPLLCDPWETPQGFEIRRIAGNVGRSGLAMLYAPQTVRMRPHDDSRWAVINHVDFDGRPEDNFRGTSLHLSFTGYERPLDTGNQGAQDVDAFLLETRVSLHSEGKWLADLNVLQSLQSSTLSKLTYPIQCTHSVARLPSWSITSVDNWDEFLDRPQTACVIRAHQNWIARLAFVCMSHQFGRRTIIMPKVVCWECNGDLQVSSQI